MSTVAIPGSFPANESIYKQAVTAGCTSAARLEDPRRRSRAIRRRGSREQGVALETLGHAVEYLVDSRLFSRQENDPKSDQEAIQLLMHSSRAVFRECPEIVSMGKRIGRWMSAHGLKVAGLEG